MKKSGSVIGIGWGVGLVAAVLFAWQGGRLSGVLHVVAYVAQFPYGLWVIRLGSPKPWSLWGVIGLLVGLAGVAPRFTWGLLIAAPSYDAILLTIWGFMLAVSAFSHAMADREKQTRQRCALDTLTKLRATGGLIEAMVMRDFDRDLQLWDLLPEELGTTPQELDGFRRRAGIATRQ